jgi:hypothetical protein
MSEKPLDSDVLHISLAHLRCEGNPISVDLPLLSRLYDLNRELAEKFPTPRSEGLGQMGLRLESRLQPGGYWSTPINSLSFGNSGGDGTHFSFLLIDYTISEETPVIVTVPDAYGEPKEANIVLGAGLCDFLRFGLHCGYFSMAQFAFDWAETCSHYAREDWDPASYPSDNHRVVSEYVSKALAITRLIYSPDELSVLQAKYRPLMRFEPLIDCK